MVNKFTRGQTVYGLRGQQAIYMEKVSTGHLVKNVMISSEEEVPYYDDVFEIYPHVLETPPVQKIADEIAAMELKRNTLHDEISTLQSLKNEFVRLEGELIHSITGSGRFQTLKEFIKGGITHIVTNRYHEVNILTFAQAFEDKRERDLKLLTLFGRSNGDMEWKINKYYDGSGDWTSVVLAFSPEDAKEKAISIVESMISEWRADPNENKSYRAPLILSSCKRFDMQAPEDLVLAAKTRSLTELNRQLASSQETSAKLIKQISDKEQEFI